MSVFKKKTPHFLKSVNFQSFPLSFYIKHKLKCHNPNFQQNKFRIVKDTRVVLTEFKL